MQNIELDGRTVPRTVLLIRSAEVRGGGVSLGDWEHNNNNNKILNVLHEIM